MDAFARDPVAFEETVHVGVRLPAIPDGDADSWRRQLTSPLNALRLVLTIALERNVAANCLGEDSGNCLSFWPSSLYGILASEASRSQMVWKRCASQIERSLGELGRRFLALPPASLSQMFRDSSQMLNNRELAALLWALLKRVEPMSDLMAGRLGAELDVVAPGRTTVSAEATTQPTDAIERIDGSDDLAPYVSPNHIANAYGGQGLPAQRH